MCSTFFPGASSSEWAREEGAANVDVTGAEPPGMNEALSRIGISADRHPAEGVELVADSL